MPETLELVGLADKAGRMPEELSGGEQQRVAIARAMVNQPMILIADEPTGNLDPASSVGIMKLLDRINDTGTTVLMATHDHGIVDQMRKRVIELEHGTRRARRGRPASTASSTDRPPRARSRPRCAARLRPTTSREYPAHAAAPRQHQPAPRPASQRFDARWPSS